MRDDDVEDGKWRKKSSLGRSIVYLVDCASLSEQSSDLPSIESFP